MATSSDVNINIKSFVGATSSRSAILAPPPALVVTTSTLNGENLSIPNTNYGVLRISTSTTFNSAPTFESDKQTLILYNDGAAPILLSRFTFSFTLLPSRLVSPFFYGSVAQSLIAKTPVTIAAGTTASFQLSYLAIATGDYVNNITFYSNAQNSEYQIDTYQHVTNDLNILQSTTTFISNTIILGEPNSTTVTFTKKLNGVLYTATNLVLETSIVGNEGWIVTTSTNNTINILWDPDLVNNNTGTYVSTVTVAISELGTQIGTKTITNISYVNIDYSRYRNLATWISPASSYNSIVGVSLDIVNNETILTVGCGTGGDFSPQYGFGGYSLANTYSLGFRARTIIPKFPYWANVWSFKLNQFEFVYRSGDIASDTDIPYYIRKTTVGYEYEKYFGYEQSLGYQSLFFVYHSGQGTIRIVLNNLRELSGNTEFDTTLKNLTRAFHYYSASDKDGRYYQLNNTPIGDGTRTLLFRGFDTVNSVLTTVTSIVSLPNNIL